MKFIIQMIFTIVLAFIFELFLPWYSLAVAAFIGGWIFNSRASFSAGFLAIALLWTLKALLTEYGAAAPLADRVAAIFSMSKPFLYLVMAIIGGLVGGFASMAGSALNKKRSRASYY